MPINSTKTAEINQRIQERFEELDGTQNVSTTAQAPIQEKVEVKNRDTVAPNLPKAPDAEVKEPFMSAMFRAMDQNTDSSISRSEVEKFVAAEELSAESAAQFVETLDVNLDGEVDVSEFAAMDFGEALFNMFADAVEMNQNTSVEPIPELEEAFEANNPELISFEPIFKQIEMSDLGIRHLIVNQKIMVNSGADQLESIRMMYNHKDD